jgi:sugar lactone lactonase YvrE
VAAYDAQGNFLRAVAVGGPNSTCPAFAGPQLSALICTSARAGMTPEALVAHPDAGCVFVEEGVTKGQAEHQVIL